MAAEYIEDRDGKFNMFAHMKMPRNLAKYTLFRGTTDFSQLEQFDLYESGYPYLVLVSVPKFMEKMAESDTTIKGMFDAYKHVIEYEFRGLDSGIDNITAESTEINNGMQGINVITKVTAPSATTFSMRYWEKSGSLLTRIHELYLRSVRDPASGFKTYNGLITPNGSNGYTPQQAGFDQECFSFLYMHTDNTGLMLERAIYFVGCMPTTAELSIYNGTKGNVEFQEIGCEFTGFPIMGSKINARAEQILQHINNKTSERTGTYENALNSWNYDYAALGADGELGKYKPS